MSRIQRHSRVPSRPTLADVSPGTNTRIKAWIGLSTRRQQLLAYGLSIGSLVRVVQQSPATVVLVEHTELALERDLARMILVEAPAREGQDPLGG